MSVYRDKIIYIRIVLNIAKVEFTPRVVFVVRIGPKINIKNSTVCLANHQSIGPCGLLFQKLSFHPKNAPMF